MQPVGRAFVPYTFLFQLSNQPLEIHCTKLINPGCSCCPCVLQLCDLYENDCIFDKFDCCMNGAATYVASGSYNNSFKVFKCADGSQGTPLEATRDPMRRRLQPVRVSMKQQLS